MMFLVSTLVLAGFNKKMQFGAGGAERIFFGFGSQNFGKVLFGQKCIA